MQGYLRRPRCAYGLDPRPRNTTSTVSTHSVSGCSIGYGTPKNPARSASAQPSSRRLGQRPRVALVGTSSTENPVIQRGTVGHRVNADAERHKGSPKRNEADEQHLHRGRDDKNGRTGTNYVRSVTCADKHFCHSPLPEDRVASGDGLRDARRLDEPGASPTRVATLNPFMAH